MAVLTIFTIDGSEHVACNSSEVAILLSNLTVNSNGLIKFLGEPVQEFEGASDKHHIQAVADKIDGEWSWKYFFDGEVFLVEPLKSENNLARIKTLIKNLG